MFKKVLCMTAVMAILVLAACAVIPDAGGGNSREHTGHRH